VGLLGLLVIGLGIHVPISNARLYLVYIYNITFIRQIDIIKYFIMIIKYFIMTATNSNSGGEIQINAKIPSSAGSKK